MKKIKLLSLMFLIFSVLGFPYLVTEVSAQGSVVCEGEHFDTSLACYPTTGRI